MESHLQYLLELAPEWIKTVRVSNGIFVKVDKKLDLKVLIKKVEATKVILAIRTSVAFNFYP